MHPRRFGTWGLHNLKFYHHILLIISPVCGGRRRRWRSRDVLPDCLPDTLTASTRHVGVRARRLREGWHSLFSPVPTHRRVRGVG